MKKIVGARRPVVGTVFYEITEEVFREAMLNADDNEINIWHKHMVKTQGLESLDYYHMYGSQILEDENEDRALYFCVTDGKDIRVNGKMVDPEQALEDYTVQDLSDAGYVEGAGEFHIQKLIKDSDFNLPNFDKEISDALESYKFTDLAEAYMELKETE